LTIVLLTERADLAADLVVRELQRRGVAHRRINQDDFPTIMHIAADPTGETRWWGPGWDLRSDRIGAAWYRSPLRARRPDPFVDAEAQALLRSTANHDWCWVNHPDAVATGSDKYWQLQVAPACGLQTPPTVITNRLDAARDHLGDVPVVAKTLAFASAETPDGPVDVFAQLVDLSVTDAAEVQAAPCIFQKRIDGTDVRVTFAGERVLAADIAVSGGTLDWRAAPLGEIGYRVMVVPDEVVEGGLALLKRGGLRYGAFDFKRTPDGAWVFLEVNPSGQWGWIEQATGLPITSAIVDVLVEARR